VRLCLHPGVEPVFIAPDKPWMNGTIEDFNGDFGEKLWEREQWRDLEHGFWREVMGTRTMERSGTHSG